MSQIAIEEIMNAIPGDTGYIIIKKDNQERKIEIKKERQTLKQYEFEKYDNKNTYMFDCFCFISGIKAQTQNSMTEIIPFKTIDGKIIIKPI